MNTVKMGLVPHETLWRCHGLAKSAGLISLAHTVADLVTAPPQAVLPYDLLEGLAAIADGRTKHVFNGSCPDKVEGNAVRDAECPACKVLLCLDASNESVKDNCGLPSAEEELKQLRAKSSVLSSIVDACLVAGYRGDTSVLDFIKEKLNPTQGT